MVKLKKMSPARFIVLAFATVITIGAILLMLPVSTKAGVKLTVLEAFFTSTSAVCVTGLIVKDTADTFSAFGQTIVALLIQIGGLGVSSVGVGLIILAGKKVSFKERVLVKEALNLDSMKGIVKIVKAVLLMTICFEGAGAILNFVVFSKDYSTLRAIGISLFHSISSFNNAGFDILGGSRSLTPYQNNVLLNLTTCGLVIFGGLGFYVIKEMIQKRSFKRFSLHSKVVLVMSGLLLVIGTLLLKITQDITWLEAFFQSTSSRTAGFSTYPTPSFTNAGLFVLILFMFVGASPGSTGGGIKTTTAFTLIKSVYSMTTNKHSTAFKRKIPNENITKAFVITFLSLSLICVNVLLLNIFDPHFSFMQILFEVVSAFGTVGLSTGITPDLSNVSKVIIIVTMFTGRLGALTMASIWFHKSAPNIKYSEENITIG